MRIKVPIPSLSVITLANSLNMSQVPTRRLGRNGPQVTALGFGALGLSTFYGKKQPDEERFEFLDHAHKIGARNWDTADVYGDNEDLIGEWFRRSGKRDDVSASPQQHSPGNGKGNDKSEGRKLTSRFGLNRHRSSSRPNSQLYTTRTGREVSTTNLNTSRKHATRVSRD